MINNVLLISGVQQRDTVIHIHVTPFFKLYSHLDYYTVLNSASYAPFVSYILETQILHLSMSWTLLPIFGISSWDTCGGKIWCWKSLQEMGTEQSRVLLYPSSAIYSLRSSIALKTFEFSYAKMEKDYVDLQSFFCIF